MEGPVQSKSSPSNDTAIYSLPFHYLQCCREDCVSWDSRCHDVHLLCAVHTTCGHTICDILVVSKTELNINPVFLYKLLFYLMI